MLPWDPEASGLGGAWMLQSVWEPNREATQTRPRKTVQAPKAPDIPDISATTAASAELVPADTAHQNGHSQENPSIWLPVGALSKDVLQDKILGPSFLLLRQSGWLRDNDIKDSTNLEIWINTDMTSRRHSQRSISKLRNAVKQIMAKIDCSPEAWTGQRDAKTPDADISNGAEDESLWYIFNTLENPNPNVEIMKDPWAQGAMEDLLSADDFVAYGLKTPLYPYQRRSAAAMVQREAQPAQMLDPRLQPCQTPTGVEYYYDKEDGIIVREKSMYSEACGGILAETMGCGKTLICLAVICATRGHVPMIPIQYLTPADKPDPRPVREKVGSLMDMAAAAVGRHSQPWKNFFIEKRRQGAYHYKCIKACERECGFYEIPPHQTRYQGRNSMSYQRPPSKRIRICSGTIIVAPNNLVDHWENQIKTHTECLKILILRSGSDKTPSADQLMKYDVVLFSKTRFEREAGEATHNRRNSYVQIESPLTELHWLRMIVDEGHNVAGSGSKTNMIHLINQLHFERRWVISGTPSTGLYGVEVSLASLEAKTSDTESSEKITAAALKTRKKTGNAIDNEMKDLDRIRRIVIEFLDLKPWSNSRADDPADWTKYIKPLGEDGKRRKTPAIRATLQGLVLRHRLDVVSQEITLPKLYNKVVYLRPTYYDRLSINLFLFSLAVNSITSERQGPDYMFDPSNRKSLNQTINNLRQAGFWWVGFDKDLPKTVEVALEYLEKKRESMTVADINQLNKGVEIARGALQSSRWRELQSLHELGVFVAEFPEDNRDHWALDPQIEDGPLLMGITQARFAQKYVTKQLRQIDPTQGLSGHGITVRQDLRRSHQRTSTKGAPESAHTPAIPSKARPSPSSTNKSPKKTFNRNIFCTLPAHSPLNKTSFVGTASAKLTYLLDQVLLHQEAEKIIIFYDNINSAFWIAEGLELIGIDFRIYASTLSPKLRTEYLTLFRESNNVRVLLMDLRQASHGLHIAQASRVYIVNPIWQPNVESQAIKRAHRIGQNRTVYVETLVLQDTLEDRMLRRRKEMSEAEMQHAEKSLLDDTAMSDIIQNEPFLDMPGEDSSGAAYLDRPTGFFDRHRLPIPDNEVAEEGGSRKRSHTAIATESDADSDATTWPENRAFPTLKPKRSRIGFAQSVQMLGNDVEGDSDSLSPRPLFPDTSPPDNDGNFENARVSLFGP
ncbi:uncharacterized protein N7503_001814 [Penicillium pulvis]|uniref:uncharacterized protein n=1 Tax=Penicillium pulvis TaxID=1562058 RepID=UPI002546E132|nr:uncharacterized protein N7503_001814 [Penicillium pulvis]KAJ5809596.1 hypothetical protein N7503_001814 [Penicillium pulvis]